MNNTIARYLALPLLSAGIIGAALGLAGTASAAQSSTSSSSFASPQTYAHAAPEAVPGYEWHRHHFTLIDPHTAASFPSSMG